LKSPTAAGATIKRPIASKDVPNPEQTPAGETADKYWPRPEAADTATNVPGEKTYTPAFKNKVRQKQFVADLANPKDINYGNMNV
jgi:hypothetical protein